MKVNNLQGILLELKVAFFQKVRFVFLNLQISKKIFQKAILSLKFKFLTNNTLLLLAGNLNFKLRIAFWNIFFWRFEKRIALSEKKPLDFSQQHIISDKWAGKIQIFTTSIRKCKKIHTLF